MRRSTFCSFPRNSPVPFFLSFFPSFFPLKEWISSKVASSERPFRQSRVAKEILSRIESCKRVARQRNCRGRFLWCWRYITSNERLEKRKALSVESGWFFPESKVPEIPSKIERLSENPFASVQLFDPTLQWKKKSLQLLLLRSRTLFRELESSIAERVSNLTSRRRNVGNFSQARTCEWPGPSGR